MHPPRQKPPFFHLRRAELEDYPQCHQVIRECTGEPWTSAMLEDQRTSWLALCNGLEQGASLVLAEQEEQLQGMALFYWGFSGYRGMPVLEIAHWWLRSSNHERAVGEALFHTLAECAAAEGCCRLEGSVDTQHPFQKTCYLAAGGITREDLLLFHWPPGAWPRGTNALPPCSLECNIHPCRPEDLEAVMQRILDLGLYEQKDPSTIWVTPEKLRKYCTGVRPRGHLLVAHTSQDDLLGFVLYTQGIDVDECAPFLSVDMLFVQERARGKGLGSQLLAALSAEATASQCCRIEWLCFSWNQATIRYYESLGARVQRQKLCIRFPRYLDLVDGRSEGAA